MFTNLAIERGPHIVETLMFSNVVKPQFSWKKHPQVIQAITENQKGGMFAIASVLVGLWQGCPQ